MKSNINKSTFLFWINKIFDFFKQQNLNIDPLPNVEILYADQEKNDIDNILISTGGYCPITQTIMLYVDNRHIKDVLRSFCHELVHHMQWIDNPDYMRRITRYSTIIDSPELEEIESEAYLKGNLLFRKFTEHMSNILEKSK